MKEAQRGMGTLKIPADRRDHLMKRIRNMNSVGSKDGTAATHMMPAEERREHIRRDCLIPVECATLKRMGTEFATNISTGGIHLETRMPVNPNETISLVLTVPHTSIAVKVNGKMAWRTRTGIGVQLTGFERQLESIIESLPG